MDRLDKRIITCLNKNARKSYRKIAKELCVSLATVANRIKNMEDAGIIQGYIPIINQEKVGYELIGIVNIKISQGKLLTVQRKISQDTHVFGVYVPGPFW